MPFKLLKQLKNGNWTDEGDGVLFKRAEKLELFSLERV